MIPEPAVRPDGRCALPGCNKRRLVPKGKWAREAAAKDPWCSTECCRKWHGTSLPETLQERGARTRDMAA